MTDVTTLHRVNTPADVKVAEIFDWAKKQGLETGVTWHFLGYADKDTKLTFSFKDKGKAMLFKLTFGGQ